MIFDCLEPLRQQIASSIQFGVAKRSVSPRSAQKCLFCWRFAALSAIIRRFRTKNMRPFTFYCRLSDVKNTKKSFSPLGILCFTRNSDFRNPMKLKVMEKIAVGLDSAIEHANYTNFLFILCLIWWWCRHGALITNCEKVIRECTTYVNWYTAEKLCRNM